MITCIHVKFIFDSVRLDFSSSVNMLQIADVALRVVFFCFQPLFPLVSAVVRGTQRQFSENICLEDDLRSRIFGTFVVKFLACLRLLGFSNT